MNHRPLHSVALASLVAMTQILSACSESSAASPAAVGSDIQSSSSREPVVNSDASGADDSELLVNLLTTGADSNDSDSHWNCSTDAGDQNYFVRYWADGTGYLSESDFRWQATSGDTAEMSIGLDTTMLSDVQFIDEEVAFDRFVATRDAGERIDCRWGGPSRYNELGLQADSTNGLPQLLAGDRGSRDWSCIVNQSDGSVTTPLLTYAIDRTGAGEKGAFNWYFDDDLLFMVSDSGQDIDVFHDFSVVNGGTMEGPLSFAAQVEDAAVSCSSDD